MVKIVSIVLLLTSSVLSLPTQHSSTEGSEWTPYIIGGSEVTPYSLPYQAFIDIEFVDSKTWCGASIISKNYLLTASHCIHNPPQVLKEIIAQLGVHTLNSANAGSVTQRIPAANVRYHDTMDAAVIRLVSTITYSDIIQPVALPQPAEWGFDYAGYAGTASGWGRSEQGYLLTLRSVTNNVMSMEGCREFFGNLESHFVCLEGSNGRSACYGDSGGPLVVVNAAGQLTQIGISSFISGHGCTTGYPSAYTRITSFASWIRDNSDAYL